MRSRHSAMFRSMALLCIACLAGCAQSNPPTVQVSQNSCLTPHSQKVEAITLAFGLSKPGGAQVTTAEWKDFLATTVTPLFPAGLSVVNAQGQWQDTPDQPITHETAKLVWIMAPDSPTLVPALNSIRETYKKLFNQKSVAAFVHSGCVSF